MAASVNNKQNQAEVQLFKYSLNKMFDSWSFLRDRSPDCWAMPDAHHPFKAWVSKLSYLKHKQELF